MSKGFTQVRARVTRYLIERHGYRHVFWEDHVMAMRTLDGELDRCRNGAAFDEPIVMSTLRAGSRVTELLPLLKWLCDWNRNRPSDPVRVYGTDLFDPPGQMVPLISTAVDKLGEKAMKVELRAATKSCAGWKRTNWGGWAGDPSFRAMEETTRLPDKPHRRCLGALFALSRRLDREARRPSGKLAPDVLLWARLALFVRFAGEQYLDVFVDDFSRALRLRDAAHAWVVSQHLRAAGENHKGIYLAHNVHVAKAQSRIVPPDPEINHWVAAISTGEYLRGQYGRGYRAIAVTGYHVWGDGNTEYPVPNVNDSLDWTLTQYGDRLLLDVSAPLLSAYDHWWMHNEHLLNGTYLRPREQYDGVVFVKDSPMAEAWERPGSPPR
jgi:erythromycin esterase-like protein